MLVGEQGLQAARGSSCQPVSKETEMSLWPFWPVGHMPGQQAAWGTQLGEGRWGCPFQWGCPPTAGLNPNLSLVGAACVGTGRALKFS